MKTILKFSLLFIAIGFFSCSHQKQEEEQVITTSTAIKIGERKTIFSKFLNEERAYLVYLPESYQYNTNSKKKYPVLVLLDGAYHFHSASGVTQFMSSNGLIPEMIVVAIPNTDRTRDLSPSYSGTDWDGNPTERFATSGGGENFLSFINDELLPEIDKNYATLNLKVFVGHSLGGLMAAAVFLSNNTPFDAFISIDPSLWWNNFEYVKKIKHNPTPEFSKTKSFFMASAHNSDSEIDSSAMRISQAEFYNELLNKKPVKLPVSFKIYEDDSHNSVPLKALYDGLEFTFKSFKTTPAVEDNIELYKAHFENLSKHWEIDLKPAEDDVNNLGYYYMQQNNQNLAKSYFELNVTLYPNSANAYDSLGEWYLLNEDKENALINYSKSVELNPINPSAINIIQELKLVVKG